MTSVNDIKVRINPEANGEEKFERCCVCGRPTSADRVTDISKRKYYVKGAGQLCTDCYFELYSENNDFIEP